jgi:hypothetical protein
MMKRTKQQWLQIMQAYSAFTGSTIAFCREHNIPQQTFYSQLKKRQIPTANVRKFVADKKLTPSQFVKAQVTSTPAAIVLQTQCAQLSLPAQCCPVWVAKLLKELAA